MLADDFVGVTSSGEVTTKSQQLERVRNRTLLVKSLSLRDIKVRYKQTVLGAAWAIIQPVMNSLVFTLFFNKLAGVGGNDPLGPRWYWRIYH